MVANSFSKPQLAHTVANLVITVSTRRIALVSTVQLLCATPLFVFPLLILDSLQFLLCCVSVIWRTCDQGLMQPDYGQVSAHFPSGTIPMAFHPLSQWHYPNGFPPTFPVALSQWFSTHFPSGTIPMVFRPLSHYPIYSFQPDNDQE